MNFFKKIFAGVKWFGKEVGKAFTELPKLIKISDDARKVGADVIPETIVVVKDAGVLATAVVKDSGVFLKGFGELSAAISTAIARKALDITADEGVIVAFEAFVKDFNAENVQDVIAAIDQIVSDAQSLDEKVEAGLQKLEADAK